nr:hypothetical protein [Thalassomonas actiniarum]
MASGVSPEIFNDENFVRAASVLDDVERFDANFFELSPKRNKAPIPSTGAYWNALMKPWKITVMLSVIMMPA